MLSIIITLIVVGVLLYVVETLLPIDARIKRVIYIIVVLFVILWLLSAVFGLGLPFAPRL